MNHGRADRILAQRGRRGFVSLALLFLLAAFGSAEAQSRVPGTWQGETPSLGLVSMELRLNGTILTGTFRQNNRASGIRDGTVDGNTIEFKVEIPGATGLITMAFTGRVAGDEIALNGRRHVREEDIIPFQFLDAPAVWRLAVKRVPPGAAPARGKGAPFPRQLTLFDRRGKVIRRVGEPGDYFRPMLSPDGTRLMALQGPDIWIFDIATGRRSRYTPDASLYRSAAVWSPDGTAIAYTSFRENHTGVYRMALNNSGNEDLVYRHTPGVVAVRLTDWSPDGRFLSFFVQGDVLYTLPLDGSRKAIELVREEYSASSGQLSSDSRLLAYVSDESGRDEIYVRMFDPASKAFPPGGGKWQISDGGGRGVYWRLGGRELYYLTLDGGVMAVAVATTPAFKAGAPRLLFRAPGAINLQDGSVSRDGRQFVFAVPAPPRRKPVAVPADILAGYAGTYLLRIANDGIELREVAVTLEGGQLTVQLGAGGEKLPLTAESETAFFGRQSDRDIDIEFVRDGRGAVTHLIQYTGGPGAKAARK